MASSVAPVPALFVPQSSTSSLDTGSALPMDWEDVSVKDEPPDVLNGLPGELTAVNDDIEDSKDMITVNSLGEVHYLSAGSTGMVVIDPVNLSTRTVVGDLVPAGSTSLRDPVSLSASNMVGDNVTEGVTVKVEEDDCHCPSLHPLNVAHIKEEEPEEAPTVTGTSGTVATSDLSYLDDPRWYMSPEDKEIEPESSYTPSSEVITVEPSTLVDEPDEVTCSTLLAEHNDGVPCSSGVQGGTWDKGSVQGGTWDKGSVQGGTWDKGSVQGGTWDKGSVQGGTWDKGSVKGGTWDKGSVQGVSKITKGKVTCAKQVNSVMSQSEKGKGKHGVYKTTKGTRFRSKWHKVGTEKVLPCVVQLCQVHHCGVDCRCTVKAPYPAKLKAVTISTEQNVMSLNRSKSSHKRQSKTTAQKPGSNMLAMSRAPNRTGLGKRLVKPSNKLKLYMEERNKKATKREPSTNKEPGTKNKFVCPICEKGFSYIFSFKQHIITHDVTEILNMNLPPKSNTIVPKGEANTGATETGRTETGATETGRTETGTTETGRTETGTTETGRAETGTTETGRTETGTTETGRTETGSTETGSTETAAKDTPSVNTSQEGSNTVVTDTEGINQEEANQEEANQEEASQANSPDSSASPPTRYKTLRTLLSDDAPQGSVDTESHQQVSALLGKGATTPPSRKSRRKVKSSSEKMIASPGSKTSSFPQDTMSPAGKHCVSTEGENSTMSSVVLKVPTFKPASQQQKKLQQQHKNKKRKKAAEVAMSCSLGLGEVVTYEKGMKINEATFNVKDSTSSVPEETAGKTAGQESCVDEQQAAIEPEQPAPVEPNTQRVIVIAPINDFSPQPGTDDCRTTRDLPTPVVDDCADTNISPEAKSNEGRKPVKRLKTSRAKPGLEVKLNIKQKLPAIKRSPTSAACSPPPLTKRSPTRAKSTPSPFQQIKTSPKTSPKSSPRAKPKAGALKGETQEDDGDSDATSPYGDDNDRDADFSAADDDEDEDYVPNTNSKKGVLGRSASMMQWMKQFSVKKKQKTKYSSMGSFQALAKKKEGGKKGSRALKAPTTTINTPSTNTSGVRRGQSRSLGGRNAHSNNNNNNNNKEQQGSDGDMDSGIDLESDGSEQKKAAVQPAVGDQVVVQKKSTVSETARVLQMLNGQLVSRKELWACVQERLDDRKQRGAVQCPMCNKEFHYPSALKRHIMMHTDEREYQCSQCPKAFSRKPHLTEHIRVHTGERPFKCAHCPAAFAQRTNLKIHNRTHTGARPFKCPECGKRFRRQDAHTQHILTHHSKVKPYKCSQCAAAFPCARYLKDHLRVHSTERPFKCEMCPAAFVCKKYLLLHVRALHLNERPFCCKLCPAKFAQSGKLTEHNRVHTGERPYKCSSCGASFSRSGHLRRHLLTHTGVRPHQCNHCEASFSQQDHLKRHIRNIHNKDT